MRSLVVESSNPELSGRVAEVPMDPRMEAAVERTALEAAAIDPLLGTGCALWLELQIAGCFESLL